MCKRFLSNGFLTSVTLTLSAPSGCKKHFASWGLRAQEVAAQAAETAFRGLAESFARNHRRMLEEDQRRLEDWFKGRADEVCASDYQNSHSAIVSITCLT